MNMEGLSSGLVPIDVCGFGAEVLHFLFMEVSEALDSHTLMCSHHLCKALVGSFIARRHEAVGGGGSGMVARDLVAEWD